MHVVDITGGNKTQRHIAKEVTYFMIKRLMPRLRNIEIDVVIRKMTGDAVGFCLCRDNNRDYEIEISNALTVKDFVMTLCHEMVHVKQFVRNEMTADDRLIWKKKFISEDTAYYDLPWEKEAYAMQAKLAKACWDNNVF
jgi:hypothetical protein